MVTAAGSLIFSGSADMYGIWRNPEQVEDWLSVPKTVSETIQDMLNPNLGSELALRVSTTPLGRHEGAQVHEIQVDLTAAVTAASLHSVVASRPSLQPD